MWHLEMKDNPGVRIGGYFFTKEAAEKKLKKAPPAGRGDPVNTRIVHKLVVVESK